jgi:hypothetical protein
VGDEIAERQVARTYRLQGGQPCPFKPHSRRKAVSSWPLVTISLRTETGYTAPRDFSTPIIV